MAQYGKPEYWEARYAKDPEPFDWYQRYSNPTLRGIISMHVPKDGAVLVPGCGSSTLSEDMLDDGYTGGIASFDISRAVIDDLADRLKDRKGLTCACDGWGARRRRVGGRCSVRACTSCSDVAHARACASEGVVRMRCLQFLLRPCSDRSGGSRGRLTALRSCPPTVPFFSTPHHRILRSPNNELQRAQLPRRILQCGN